MSFRYTYICDCCGNESESISTDDNINPPRLPPDWRQFHMDECDPTDDRYITWTEHIPHDLCPTCSEYFHAMVADYKANIAKFKKASKVKAEKVV